MGEEEPSPAAAIADVDVWIETQGFNTTADLKIPEKLSEQVIGQDAAVIVIKKAAERKRRVILLIGEPGTGKSMLARSMTECISQEGDLQDVIAFITTRRTRTSRRYAPYQRAKGNCR